MLLLGAAAATAVFSLLLGALAGFGSRRALSVGFYAVGSFLIAAGFFVGNRGPVRLKGETAFLGSRLLRWATPAEREQTLADSAIFVALGTALIFIGIATDARTGLI